MNKESYTAASSVPLKVLLDRRLVRIIEEDKRILPRHIQLNPENKCTQDCSWCSCSARDKTLEMPYETVMGVMGKFKNLGAKSVTITGGGEPLLHPRINEMIKGIYNLGIEIGLVTNGDLIDRLGRKDLEKITWMRVSLGDEKKTNQNYWTNLTKAVERGKTDWSFSYVAANQIPNYKLIGDMVEFANHPKFTHVRIVNDIFNAEKLGVMQDIKLYLRSEDIDDKKVIYQDRGKWTKGVNKCLISLLKPVITADGKLAPCCGTQYKDDPPAKDYVADWGTIKDIDKIWKEQKYYNGSKCVKCYYDNYNILLSRLLEGIKHKNFI